MQKLQRCTLDLLRWNPEPPTPPMRHQTSRLSKLKMPEWDKSWRPTRRSRTCTTGSGWVSMPTGRNSLTRLTKAILDSFRQPIPTSIRHPLTQSNHQRPTSFRNPPKSNHQPVLKITSTRPKNPTSQCQCQSSRTNHLFPKIKSSWIHRSRHRPLWSVIFEKILNISDLDLVQEEKKR